MAAEPEATGGEWSDDDIAFAGCLGFAAFAWIAPMLFMMLIGLAIYGGTG